MSEKSGDAYVFNEEQPGVTLLEEQQLQQSSAAVDFDKNIFKDLNSNCEQLTTELEEVIKKVSSTLHKSSAITVGNIQTCVTGVEDLGKTIDESVRSMYSLIASSEELDREMKPIYEIAEKVKRIKTVLTALEDNMAWETHVEF